MLTLSNSKLEKLSDIAAEIGIVFFASVVLPAVLDKLVWVNVIIGSILALLSWLISLVLIKS